MKVLEFWFEFGSTYSYPAALRIEALAGSRGVALAWRPFLLGPIFRAQGWEDSPFNLYPAKGRYMWRDLARLCEREGLPLRRPSRFPRNGLLAARVACANESAHWLPEFARRVYVANFAEDREISDPEVIASILASLVPGRAQEILQAAQTSDSKAKLRRQTERAAELGIFGAPSFVADGELFWGDDRMEQAFDWLAAARE